VFVFLYFLSLAISDISTQYARVGGTLPFGAHDNNVLIFPNGVELVGAFLPLTSISHMHKS